LDLQVLEFVKVRKQFFVAQLYNLPAQPLARKESEIRSKKIRPLPLERCPVSSSINAIAHVISAANLRVFIVAP
jgi:hypothetical protein